jgi:hypothetical protein
MGTVSSHLSTLRFGELYQDLLEAKVWFRSIRLPTSGNRFSAILSNVGIVSEHYNKSSIQTVLGCRPVAELWISVLDGCDFVDIHKEFRTLNSSQLPRRRLREILSGPLLPHEEDLNGSTIHARSALFELEFAARMRARGIAITGFDDIQFELQGLTVNVQCKRPQSASRLQENIQSACLQISRRIANTGKRGLIALRVDRLLETDTNIWKVADDDQLRVKFKHILDKFLRKHSKEFKLTIDVPIIGIIIDLPFIAEVRARGSLVVRGYETVIYSFCSDSTKQVADARVMVKLAERMMSYAESGSGGFLSPSPNTTTACGPGH